MKVLCLDMDSFFASVEIATNPALKDTPMAVTGAGERTVILSASYPARKKGVKTGQTTGEALAACPGLKLVKASNKKYTYVSSMIAEYLKSISPTARMFSIDEAFMDITDIEESSQEIGYRIKTWLKQHLKITGSVGIGESYILAKMASNVKKPDGYYEVLPEHRVAFIDGFKLKSIWGIGRRTVEKLNAAGMFTPADVRRRGEDELFDMYGVPGLVIHRSCCGLDKGETDDKDAPLKSISHAITAPEDIADPATAFAYMLQLSEAVSTRARKRLYSGRTVTLTVRESGMKTYSFRQNLGFYTSATHHIYEAVKSLFIENVSLSTPLRLMGVGLDNLIYGSTSFANMEDMIEGVDDRNESLYKAIDEINGKYNNGLVRGSVLKIGFRQPQGISFSFKKDSFWRSIYSPPDGLQETKKD